MNAILNNEEELLKFRSQIDEIDDKIIELLLQRSKVVMQVGEYKRQKATAKCPIRPGREAEMLRRILKRFEGTGFSPVGAAAIWRIIIGTSTALESDMTLCVYAPEKESDLFWLAREYFGMASPVIKEPHIKRVIGNVMDNKAAVGIVPLLQGNDSSDWWTSLLQPGDDTPKVFAHVPFVYPAGSPRNVVGALALAKLTPEPSGDDISLLVVEANHDVSQHRLQGAFTTAKIEANWLATASLTPGRRHHLVQLAGFHPKDSAPLKSAMEPLADAIFNITFLGAYAVPVNLSKNSTDKGTANAATAKA